MLNRVLLLLLGVSRGDPAALLRLGVLIALILLTSGLTVLTPIMFKEAIDSLAGTFHSSWELSLWALGAYVAAFFSMRVASVSRWITYGPLEQRLYRLLRLHIFDHVHSLPLQFHVKKTTGELQQITNNGLLGLRSYLFHSLFLIGPFLVQITTSLIVVATQYEPLFVTAIAGTLVLYLGTLVMSARFQQRHLRDANNSGIAAVGHSTDSYLNYQTIKHYGAHRRNRAEFNRHLSRSERSWRNFYKIVLVSGFLQAFWISLGLGVIVIFAARNVSTQAMTVGDFTLVTAYLLQMIQPAEEFAFAYREIKVGRVSVERLFGLLDREPEASDLSSARQLPEGPVEVAFSNVGFGYEDQGLALRDISFRIGPGETVAIVGPSGSGKSTIAQLLFRFLEPDQGQIQVGGCDTTDLVRSSLRQAISVVPQDIMLLNSTIEENIKIACESAALDDIEEAARIAELHNFIASQPDGYQTLVGERGLRLSGGERQRIAIARAVLKRPRILVFDEATSSLDSATEQAVLQNLGTLSRDTATLIIAHRLSTVAAADEVLVLAGGEILERGTHEDLLRMQGRYFEMWAQQQHEENSPLSLGMVV